MMICYLAAKYTYRTTVLKIAVIMAKHHHRITSAWLDGSHTSETPEDQASYARMDLLDIYQATTLVLFQFPVEAPEDSTGRHVEFGYALAREKRMILVGKKTSVFHHLPHVEHYPTVQAFFDVYCQGEQYK